MSIVVTVGCDACGCLVIGVVPAGWYCTRDHSRHYCSQKCLPLDTPVMSSCRDVEVPWVDKPRPWWRFWR